MTINGFLNKTYCIWRWCDPSFWRYLLEPSDNTRYWNRWLLAIDWLTIIGCRMRGHRDRKGNEYKVYNSGLEEPVLRCSNCGDEVF